MKQRSESLSQSRTKQRKALLSWAWSFCTHLVFVLALNFVVMNGAADRNSFEIMAINEATAEQELTLIPEFELISPYELETVEQELLPEIVELAASLQPMQLAKPTEPSEPEPVESVGEKPAVSSEAATVAMPRARAIAVANIQGRVVKAGGKRGEVQFALAWKNFNDVDLHVIAPSGEHISHQHRRSQCLGMLDVDMNVKGESQEPVENIRWISQAPWGRYTVLINLFRLHPDGARRPKRETAYELLAQLGEETSVRDGIVSPGSQVDVMRFVYFPQQLPPLERQQGLNQIQALQEGEESAAKPLLEDAKQSASTVRQRKLQNIVRRYPHTDAAIEAMQLMVGEIVKR